MDDFNISGGGVRPTSESASSDNGWRVRPVCAVPYDRTFKIRMSDAVGAADRALARLVKLQGQLAVVEAKALALQSPDVVVPKPNRVVLAAVRRGEQLRQAISVAQGELPALLDAARPFVPWTRSAALCSAIEAAAGDLSSGVAE